LTEGTVLRPFESYGGGTLRWAQPSRARRYFELVGPDGCYATLEWKGVFTYVAIARTVDGSYSLDRGGFLHPYVTIKKDPYDQEIGRMRMRLGGSCDLELADGRRVLFKRAGILNTKWSFHLEDGPKLCTFTKASGFLRRQADVTLEPDAARVRDLPILLILGWFQINLEWDMAMAASAGAASSR